MRAFVAFYVLFAVEAKRAIVRDDELYAKLSVGEAETHKHTNGVEEARYDGIHEMQSKAADTHDEEQVHAVNHASLAESGDHNSSSNNSRGSSLVSGTSDEANDLTQAVNLDEHVMHEVNHSSTRIKQLMEMSRSLASTGVYSIRGESGTQVLLRANCPLMPTDYSTGECLTTGKVLSGVKSDILPFCQNCVICGGTFTVVHEDEVGGYVAKQYGTKGLPNRIYRRLKDCTVGCLKEVPKVKGAGSDVAQGFFSGLISGVRKKTKKSYSEDQFEPLPVASIGLTSRGTPLYQGSGHWCSLTCTCRQPKSTCGHVPWFGHADDGVKACIEAYR